MMKRILSVVLLLCVLGLTGCGSQTPAPTPTPAATPSAMPTPTPEPTPTPDPVAEALAAKTTPEKVGPLLTHENPTAALYATRWAASSSLAATWRAPNSWRT